MKKNFIISVVIIAVILGGYYLLKNNNFTVYTDPTYGFSINLPEGMEVSNFEEGEGKTVLITNDKLLMTNEGMDFQMQIYTSPFDEDIVLTEERIKQDLPDMMMENVGEIKVGGIPAVLFTSSNEQNQKTVEIWFVYKNNLYQISSLSENGKDVEKIIKSWQWQS